MTSAIDGGGAGEQAGTTASSSSLAYTDQTEPSERPLSCPYGSDRVIVELYSGQVYPDRCRSNLCPFCLPLNARRRCIAITMSAPQRMIRLSLVAGLADDDPCTTARFLLKLVRRNLKRMNFDPGEWCWTIERNPEKTGYHAHCLQRGRSIPQAELQEACFRAGAGIPYINSIVRKGIWTSRYGLKGFGADGYGLKTFRANADSREALKINHGRMEHHSTGFYAIDGDILKVRDMERVAIAEMNNGKPLAFIGCHPDNVNRILGSMKLSRSLIRDLNQRSAQKMRTYR